MYIHPFVVAGAACAGIPAESLKQTRLDVTKESLSNL